MGERALRQAFTAKLEELADARDDLYVVTSDARGSVGLTRFFERFPSRAVEAGIAEMSAVSVAAGIASCGNKVFCCGPAGFLSARSLEQIKTDIVYNQSNVAIVGVSGGVSYGALGFTHHSLHDIAVMRTFPGINVIVPSDAVQMEQLTEQLCGDATPAYVRIGRGPVDVIYGSDVKFNIGKAHVVHEGETNMNRICGAYINRMCGANMGGVCGVRANGACGADAIGVCDPDVIGVYGVRAGGVSYANVNGVCNADMYSGCGVNMGGASYANAIGVFAPDAIDACDADAGLECVDVLIIACGEMVAQALPACELLEKDGVKTTLLDMHTIKPLDADKIMEYARTASLVVTVEEHSVYGGLGGAVSEYLSQNHPVRMMILGLPDEIPVTGSSQELFRYYGLDSAGIYRSIKQRLFAVCVS